MTEFEKKVLEELKAIGNAISSLEQWVIAAVLLIAFSIWLHGC